MKDSLIKDRIIWFKGELIKASEAKVHVLSPTAQYGLNVFEGLRAYWSEEHEELFIFRLEEHLKRLERSCKILSITSPYNFSEITDAIIKVLHANKFRCDVSIRITMSIKEIMSSVKRTISVKLPSGREEIVDVKFGAGIQNGVVLKYTGLGDDSDSNLPRGNLLIRVTILDSDGFTRKGNDIWTDKKITAFEAIRGCEFNVRDLEDNIVKVKVPAGTQPSSVLQLKNKGMPVHESLNIRGNMYIKIHITIPKLTKEQLNKIKDL